MDPNATLNRALAAAFVIIRRPEQEDATSHDLAEAVLDLHDWLRKGGFAPKAWDQVVPSSEGGA